MCMWRVASENIWWGTSSTGRWENGDASCNADATTKFPPVIACTFPWLYCRRLGGSPPVSWLFHRISPAGSVSAETSSTTRWRELLAEPLVVVALGIPTPTEVVPPPPLSSVSVPSPPFSPPPPRHPASVDAVKPLDTFSTSRLLTGGILTTTRMTNNKCSVFRPSDAVPDVPRRRVGQAVRRSRSRALTDRTSLAR